MDEALADTRAAVARGHGAKVVLSGAAEWLHLMAAPTFAIMALVTGISGDSAMAMLCAHDASPLSGMAAMYGLMSAFHLGPWLKLISKR
jgi:hypothetical protein